MNEEFTEFTACPQKCGKVRLFYHESIFYATGVMSHNNNDHSLSHALPGVRLSHANPVPHDSDCGMGPDFA